MIKGAFIYAIGLATGTVYGVVLGVRYTKGLERALSTIADAAKNDSPATEAVVTPDGTVVQ